MGGGIIRFISLLPCCPLSVRAARLGRVSDVFPPVFYSISTLIGTLALGTLTGITPSHFADHDSNLSSYNSTNIAKVLWKITPSFATWLSHPNNPLFTTHFLTPSSTILELGSGISPLNALSLSRLVSRHVLTDQPYVQKLIQRNIDTNLPPAPPKRGHHQQAIAKIHFKELDWETDEVTPALTGSESVRSFDAVLACDCVYNYALVEPFVQTCVDACRLRARDDEGETPCVCIVAQQLRNDEVFENWLERFHMDFRVWRVPDESLPDELRPSAGFAVHIGILRDNE